MRRIAIIESPFRANEHTEATHRAYLERLIRYVTLDLGCTPYASHKMLTDALDDGDEEERIVGMGAGLDMSKQILRCHKWSSGPEGSLSYRESVPRIIFGLDYGFCTGMKIAEATFNNIGFGSLIEHVHIGRNP